MARQNEAIDLLRLYSRGDTAGWNELLNVHVRDQNINGLARLRYSVQAGMDDLAKKKLATEPIQIWYCRLIKSIENSARAILRRRHPMPHDNPLTRVTDPRAIEAKKKRDTEFSKFLIRSSY